MEEREGEGGRGRDTHTHTDTHTQVLFELMDDRLGLEELVWGILMALPTLEDQDKAPHICSEFKPLPYSAPALTCGGPGITRSRPGGGVALGAVGRGATAGYLALACYLRAADRRSAPGAR
eukprot:447267-Rhodomonas_salina.1